MGMLNHKLLKDLVEDALREGLRRRYPTFNLFIVEYMTDGMVRITFSLPSGNLSSVECSLTSVDYIHEWLDRLDRLHPRISAYFKGSGSAPEFHHEWK